MWGKLFEVSGYFYPCLCTFFKGLVWPAGWLFSTGQLEPGFEQTQAGSLEQVWGKGGFKTLSKFCSAPLMGMPL